MPFEAIVRFKKTEEDGRYSPPKSGYHPQLRVGDDFASVIIRLKNSGLNESPMALGEEHKVVIELQNGSPYHDKISTGMNLAFYEGNKLVGVGRIIEKI